MKKYLALVLSMILVLGFAVSAFAIHAEIPAETSSVVAAKDTQIELSGELRIRGWYEDNIMTPVPDAIIIPGDGTTYDYEEVIKKVKSTTGLPFKGGSMSWYDQRIRLAIDVKTAPNVSGRVHLETGDVRGDVYSWGATNSIAGEGGYKPLGPTRVLEAWLAYTGSGLLGVPAGIKVGHMPLVVGEGTFFDHRRYGDDAILLYVEPMKGTEINLVAAKLFEGASHTQDLETGVIQVECRAGDGRVTYVDLGRNCPSGHSVTGGTRIINRATGPTIAGGITDNTDDIDLYSLMITHKLDKDNTLGLNYSIVNSRDMNRVLSAGTLTDSDDDLIDAKLNLQNIGIFAKGKISGIGYRATADFQFGKIKDTGSDDMKFRGWGVTLGANYKLDPVTLRANFIYGSGDDDDDNKMEQFVAFPAAVIDPNIPTVVYNYRVVTAAGAIATGIANTTAFNLGVDYSPVKDLRLALDYWLLRASKKPDEGISKKVGSELDLKATYRLSKNLTYFINSGILFAGKMYKDFADEADTKKKNAIVFHHGLTLSF